MKVRINHDSRIVRDFITPYNYGIGTNIGGDIEFCENVLEAMDVRDEGADPGQLIELMDCQLMDGDYEESPSSRLLFIYMTEIPSYFNINSIESDDVGVTFGLVLNE